MRKLGASLFALVLATPLAAQPQILSAERFDGRPAFGEGVDLGYFVWRDADDTWHVRWTTMGKERRFSGSVQAEGGDLRSLKRIDVDAERKLIYAGRPARVVRGPRGRVVGVRPGRTAVVGSRDEDHIEKDGDARIVFAARTDADIDGFDFKVARDATRLRFVLNVDGAEHPTIVVFGPNNSKLRNLPLFVTLRP